MYVSLVKKETFFTIYFVSHRRQKVLKNMKIHDNYLLLFLGEHAPNLCWMWTQYRKQQETLR